MALTRLHGLSSPRRTVRSIMRCVTDLAQLAPEIVPLLRLNRVGPFALTLFKAHGPGSFALVKRGRGPQEKRAIRDSSIGPFRSTSRPPG